MVIGLIALVSLQSSSVTPPSLTAAKEPQIAIEGDRVFVAYGLGDAVYLSVSNNRGASFGEPIKVGEAGKIALGNRRGPRIAVRGNVVSITTIFGVQGRGKDGDILSFRSTDGGRTWGAPVVVNDVKDAAREGLHAMAVSPDGTLACTWLDMRDAGTKLYLATSQDGGASWKADQMIYQSPGGTICECCHPSIAFDSKGKLYVMFRNSVEGARDMFLLESTDAKSFTKVNKLGSGTWMLQACPMDGGMIAVDQKGALHSIWRRDATIFQSLANGPERAFAEGRNPWIAATKDGIVSVWQSGKEIKLATPKGQVSTLSESGLNPVVASSRDGSWAVAAWTESGIRLVRL